MCIASKIVDASILFRIDFIYTAARHMYEFFGNLLVRKAIVLIYFVQEF